MEKAIDYALEQLDVSSKFKAYLIANKAEVKQMCLTEYDEEQHLAFIRREERAEGKAEGKEEGKEEGIQIGENRFSTLTEKLLSLNKYQDLEHAIEDKDR